MTFRTAANSIWAQCPRCKQIKQIIAVMMIAEAVTHAVLFVCVARWSGCNVCISFDFRHEGNTKRNKRIGRPRLCRKKSVRWFL